MLARNVQREIERDLNLQSKAAMANSDAGTSSGSAGGGKYQVFLSFCGRDTRDGFTSFLYEGLRKNGIHAFMDDEEIRDGKKIADEILQAIDGSQIYVPIFSENYTRRKWCLLELIRMVDNISKSNEKQIRPIFFYVEPNHLDSCKNFIGQLKKEHEKKQREKKQQEKFPYELESWKLESWEEAPTKVVESKGRVLQKRVSQAKFVDEIVEELLQELKIKYKSVSKDLVGLDHRVAEVLELLDVNCNDKARLLKLHGMGGIGKTTLAGVVYNELSSCFGKCCAFLDNIRETSKKEGLVSLQKELLKKIASSSSAQIISKVDDGREKIEEILAEKKILIVLDDVVKEQIENLIGQRQLHPGTRIIITTRDASLPMARELKEMNSDHALQILSYEMVAMNFDDALKLFKRHAFQEDSLATDFDDLSRNIVFTTGGLPLALEVIGSSLYKGDKVKWENTLKKLKKIPDESVQEKLMISYNDLNYRQQEIFLDVACFFINEDITNAKYMWEAFEFYPELEIEVLVRKSLMKIKDDNKFWMHDQLRDLGREIVCQQSPKNLGKCNRLWTSEKVLELVDTEERYEDVEALDLRGSNSISINPERFKSLRFLRLYNVYMHGDFIVALPKLRWISWRSPSQIDCGLSMQSKNLVVLELFDNRFKNNSKVWDLIKMATKLKSLALVECHGITKTPDLSKCLVLERLTFDNCWRLKEIDDSIEKLECLLDLNITRCGLVELVPNEIGRLEKLKHFSLKSCSKLGGLPASIGNLASLRKLDLSRTRITSLPDSIGNLGHLSDLNLLDLGITELPNAIEGLVKLQHLCLENTKIRQLPDSIGKLISLRTLDLSKTGITGDIDQWKLPETIGKLEKLEELFLCHRKELVGKIPNEIGCLSYLRVLDLFGTGICGVPSTIIKLTCLSTLDLRGCHKITKLPKLPTSLVYLRVKSRSLQVVPNLSKLTNLIELFLSDHARGYVRSRSNRMHLCDLGWIERLSKLEKLELNLVNIAAPHPKDHDLCWQLPPSLLSLELNHFNLTGSWLSNLKILSNLTLCFSQRQEIQLDGLLQLKELNLESCNFQRLSLPSSLRGLEVCTCHNMIEIQFLGMSASLEVLTIDYCKSFQRIVLCSEVGSLGLLNQSESSSRESTYCSPGLIRNALKKLKKLRLTCCKNLHEIQVIDTLSSLQDIYIANCKAMKKLSSVSNLKNLLILYICDSPKLRFVEGLDELKFLRSLHVQRCPSLEKLLDRSNSKIPDSCTIQVKECRKWLNSSPEGFCEGFIPFKRYKKMAPQGAPQPKTNKEEAKMEGDAEDPDTEPQSPSYSSASSSDHETSEPQSLSYSSASSSDHETSEPQSPSYSSASSSDHETSEEPPTNNVRDGTLPEIQNQMTQQDSNPLSLDELAPPRTFCDRFKTCLATILECVCNHDFPSVKAEIP